VLKTFLSIIGGVCILVVLAFVGIAAFSIANKNESQNQTPTSIDNSDAAAVPALSVSAPKLFADYQANEVQADNIYKGKRLAVRGMVMEIRKDFMNSIVLALGSTNEFMPVDAHLEEDESSKAAALHKWDVVNLICDGDGMVVGSPQLRNCSFDASASIQPAPAPAADQPDAEAPATPQDSSATETVTTPPQPTATSTDNNDSKPAPIVRQSPPDTQPQN
jgi:hypothetical protein